MVRGIQFPLDAKAERSSSPVGKSILYKALLKVNSGYAQAVAHEKNWRKNYPKHFRALVAAGIESPDNALQIAQDGLKEAWEQFKFVDHGHEMSLSEAMNPEFSVSHWGASFYSTYFRGKGSNEIAPWYVPYRGQRLSGASLIEQLNIWEEQGVIETSHRTALERVIAHPEWFDLSDRTLALFGAASEAGPLTWLSKWRANIVALDIPKPEVWQKILSIVEAGNARLVIPTICELNERKPLTSQYNLSMMGCDLLTQTPEIAHWLSHMSEQLDLAAIAYLDGEKHVRVSMAMDAIMATVSQVKPDTTLMFMATPTDVFAVPLPVYQESERRFEQPSISKKLALKSIRKISGNRFYTAHMTQPLSSTSGGRYGIADCLVVEQGPNYALAKRIQQWRAVVARQSGQRVAINVAPSTTTTSVVSNPLLKAAFTGADRFQVEAFAPETTNALMAALWIHDLRSDESSANPNKHLHHPLELLMENANHGGLWRSGYLPRSVLPIAALIGFVQLKLKGSK